MLKAAAATAAARLGGKKTTRHPLGEFYREWIESLKVYCKNTSVPELPCTMLDSSMSENLSIHVKKLHEHFLSYYNALDFAAIKNLSEVLYPTWRNSLETPFIWFADVHPSLFIRLIRALLSTDDEDDGIVDENRIPRKSALMKQIDQIECGLRLMLPSFAARARKAQAGLVDQIALDWIRSERKKEATRAIGGTVTAHMEEFLNVFLDVNRLRRNLLDEIIGAMQVHEQALYLQALAQFYIGFRNNDILQQFKESTASLSSVDL